ncbi:MAG: hypothetical protein IKN00_08735, partial [Bacteroidales bacterium]|nr:hypothetical protein [Bacteroidales bacterium]
MKRILLFTFLVAGVVSCGREPYVKIVDLAKLSAHYEARDGDVLSGMMDGNYQITIADGATVTLRSAVIYGVNEWECPWAGITALGNATLVLEGSNIVKGFYEEFPGIFVPEGKTLIVKGSGKLDVSSNGMAPAMGSSVYKDGIDCGNIEIQGGSIRATGGEDSAAIGSTLLTSCGSIVISGGSVSAFGGPSGAGIGSGARASCGDISITGGTVQAEGGSSAAGIGCGQEATCDNISISGGTINAVCGINAACIGSGDGCDNDGDVFEASVCGDITISGGTITASYDSILPGTGIGSGCLNSECGNILISGGTLSVIGGGYCAAIGTGQEGSAGDITITSGVTRLSAEK